MWAKGESLSDIVPIEQKAEGSDRVNHAIIWLNTNNNKFRERP